MCRQIAATTWSPIAHLRRILPHLGTVRSLLSTENTSSKFLMKRLSNAIAMGQFLSGGQVEETGKDSAKLMGQLRQVRLDKSILYIDFKLKQLSCQSSLSLTWSQHIHFVFFYTPESKRNIPSWMFQILDWDQLCNTQVCHGARQVARPSSEQQQTAA